MPTHLPLGRGNFASSQAPLARLLAEPHFAQLVPHLAPQTLHQLIRHNGLEACGELIASATPAQISAIFDLDLWRSSQPGRDDQFDADRFGEWLEVLAEGDATAAARIVAAMDERLAVAGLSQYVRVFDPATITPLPPSEIVDDEGESFAMSGAGGAEILIGGYIVRAVATETWDAIVGLLLALDAEQPECFHALMRGCRAMSNSMPEVDGLDDLLMVPAQLMHDVALAREVRRSNQGYSTAADARAFLQLARERPRASEWSTSVNVLATAYFRASDEAEASAASSDLKTPSSTPRLGPGNPSINAAAPDTLDVLVNMLAEAGLVPERPRALLERGDTQPSRLNCIRALIAYVRDHHDAAHLKRSRELAFLANTLVAGCSVQGRAFTPQEASDAAVSVCNLGLEQQSASGQLSESFLVEHDLVTAFEIGWALLHHDVSLYVAGQLITVITDLQGVDTETQRDLRTLGRKLATQHAAGTPWRASEALEVIATLDTPAWASLVGLLGECPVMPAALTATLERRAGAISATAFEFIATPGQIGLVKTFMTRLPDVLRA